MLLPHRKSPCLLLSSSKLACSQKCGVNHTGAGYVETWEP